MFIYLRKHKDLREKCREHKACQSQSYVTTDGQPASLSWNKAPIWGLRPDLDYCLTVAGLLIWGALSNERTGLSFAIATGPRQHSHFWVRVTVSTQVWKLLSCPCEAPSLMRGRVCRLSVRVGSISSLSFVQLFTILLLKPNRMYNIYKGSVSPGSGQQTMPYF
jgi:hypothetical protein